MYCMYFVYVCVYPVYRTSHFICYKSPCYLSFYVRTLLLLCESVAIYLYIYALFYTTSPLQRLPFLHFTWIKMWIFFSHTILLHLHTICAQVCVCVCMHLKIQRSVNIFTISAATATTADAVVRFLSFSHPRHWLSVCLSVFWKPSSSVGYILHSLVVYYSYELIYMCSYLLFISRSLFLDIASLLLPWQILISSYNFFSLSLLFYLLPTSSHFFRSIYPTLSFVYYYLLSSLIFLSYSISSFQFQLPSTILFDPKL